MEKTISQSYANNYGAGIRYTDGTSIQWVASLDITIIIDKDGNEIRLPGRQQI